MSAPSEYTIFIDGRVRTLTHAEAVHRSTELCHAAMVAERSAVEKYVEWGAVLVQLRPSFKRGEWCRFLYATQCRHRQKAYRAIALAGRLADGHGLLDRAKLREVIRAYNAARVEREPLIGEDSLSVASAEVALGMRPPRSAANQEMSAQRGQSGAAGGIDPLIAAEADELEAELAGAVETAVGTAGSPDEWEPDGSELDEFDEDLGEDGDEEDGEEGGEESGSENRSTGEGTEHSYGGTAQVASTGVLPVGGPGIDTGGVPKGQVGIDNVNRRDRAALGRMPGAASLQNRGTGGGEQMGLDVMYQAAESGRRAVAFLESGRATGAMADAFIAFVAGWLPATEGQG